MIDKIISKLTELNQIRHTHEKNLLLSKCELINKVKAINPDYIEVMETEAKIFVRQGLFRGYIEGNKIMFEIPDWDKFISAINSFYEVCYKPYEGEDDDD